MKVSPQVLIRIFLELVLLYFVWTNAHWSVAFFITVITIRNEIIDELILRKFWRKNGNTT